MPASSERIELMPIGNHCRGTTFLNANNLINDKLNKVFDELSSKIEGFYFGRFDLRCASETDLYNGNFKVLELNGAGSEPGHIYHPGSNLIDAYKSIFFHLSSLYKISKKNNDRGVKYMTFPEGIAFINRIRSYNKLKKTKTSAF